MCYGSLSIRAVNFTEAAEVTDESASPKVTEGFEVSVVKGCGVKADIQARSEARGGGVLSDQEVVTTILIKLRFVDKKIHFRCWDGTVETSHPASGSSAEQGLGQLASDLGVETFSKADAKTQAQTCVCDAGWYCNGVTSSRVTSLWIIVLVTIACLL